MEGTQTAYYLAVSSLANPDLREAYGRYVPDAAGNRYVLLNRHACYKYLAGPRQGSHQTAQTLQLTSLGPGRTVARRERGENNGRGQSMSSAVCCHLFGRHFELNLSHEAASNKHFPPNHLAFLFSALTLDSNDVIPSCSAA